MVLKFDPPTDLVNAYLQRPSPGQEATAGLQQALQAYAQQKYQQQQTGMLQQQRDIDLAKNTTEGGQDFTNSLASIQAQRNAPKSPNAQGPSLIDRWKSFVDLAPVGKSPDQTPAMGMDPGVPMQSTGAVSGIQPQVSPVGQGLLNPEGQLDSNAMDAYKAQHGTKGLADLEKRLTLQNTLQSGEDRRQTAKNRADEMGPKSFEYARAFAKNAGAPRDAEGFIQIAQSEGRNTLTKRELDDLKNSIGARAQQGRGEYFSGSLDLNRKKFQNTLLQEGNKALNPNVAGGALKPQQERLNRIGRAEALVAQMNSQKGGGDTRQMRELATSLASILTGGNVVAENQIAELVPHTYKGNVLKFFEKLSNNPTGLDQQVFITRLADTISREKGTINSQIQTAQKQALPGLGVLQDNNPSGYQDLMKANIKPTISSQQEYEALPAGSEYLSSDGVLHRKK